MLETAAHKVKPHHLAREACLYVRQSSLKQVETNTESTHRQYGLRRSAIALGWREGRIRVIDDDQGKSGASAANRSGFRDLMARIAAGEVGIVLSLEVSRLARNNHDWSQLLQVARIADTLILDEAGVHDPGDSSDKLLLDIKGTISEYELEGIKARLIGGQRSKAARGELRIPLPIGLDYDEDGKVALDGDQQIVAAIGLVFQAFRDKGSAMAAAKWFRAEGLRLPSRPRMGPARGELRWSLPDHSRLRRILKNPRYAGAFSYGRTTQRRQADGSLQHATLPREQWQVCIPDLHAGFITWEEYCRNQETLARNAEAFASLESRRAAPREGAALLQSLMVCGRCGQRMSVHYSKARPARNQPARAYYQCRESCVRRGERLCQSMRADTIDTALARFAVEAVNRDNIALALAVQEQVRTEFEQADAQRALRIQRLEYEAGLAQRRYYAADPANRLVAAPLERNWNERLRELEEATREREQRRTARDEELSARQVRRMEELAADFARVWDAPATGNADRKRLLRLLVEDVTLTRDGYEVYALRALATRWRMLSAEIATHDEVLETITWTAAPTLHEAFGIGTDSVAEMMIVAGDNPTRIRSEAAFAKLCGACPVPASSGVTNRHRLFRGGHRQANAALYRIVIVRMRWHQPTIDYVRRRTVEGLSKKDIIRCLKRFVAREVYNALIDDHKVSPGCAEAA